MVSRAIANGDYGDSRGVPADMYIIVGEYVVKSAQSGRNELQVLKSNAFVERFQLALEATACLRK